MPAEPVSQGDISRGENGARLDDADDIFSFFDSRRIGQFENDALKMFGAERHPDRLPDLYAQSIRDRIAECAAVWNGGVNTYFSIPHPLLQRGSLLEESYRLPRRPDSIGTPRNDSSKLLWFGFRRRRCFSRSFGYGSLGHCGRLFGFFPLQSFG